MNTIRIHQQPLFRLPSAELLTNAQRLLFFLIVSLALHGLLFALIPDIGQHAAMGQQSMRLPVTLTISPATSKKNMARKHNTIHHATVATRTSTHHPARHVSKFVHHQRRLISQRHDIALKHLSAVSSPVLSNTKNESQQTTHQRQIYEPRMAKNTPISSSADGFQATNSAVSNTSPTPSPNPAVVAALLRRALQQHFHYPAVALQNNWQGQVVLGMRVTADGQVADTRILQPSGFRVLDRAAQDSANEIGSLPAARPLLAGKSLRFRVPVAFRLQH